MDYKQSQLNLTISHNFKNNTHKPHNSQTQIHNPEVLMHSNNSNTRNKQTH